MFNAIDSSMNGTCNTYMYSIQQRKAMEHNVTQYRSIVDTKHL